MDRMKELVEILNDLAYKYYTLDAPTVSDKEYDKLYDELVSLERETGVVLENSPTKKVGGEVLSGFTTYKHKNRLYSLNKSQSKEELSSWYNKLKNKLKQDGYSDFSVSVEYKYDGLTLNLTYNNGRLVRATTRGNGVEGEDVTEQAKTIKSVPLTISYKGEFEVQGECIMRLSVLEEYNRTHDIPLKNARNAAAGALRNLDPNVTRERNLDFIAYSIGYSNEKYFSSQSEMIRFLEDNKFKIGDFIRYEKDLDSILKDLDDIESKRDSLDYLIDGAVIKVCEDNIRVDLGYTEKFPRWAIAYKFDAEEVSTIIKDVAWQVSRTGKVNPLAILEPVELCGATISRATLNNLDDIKRKDVKIGSRVFIRRSNDVIPEILGVAEHYDHSIEITPPKYCPSCGGEVVRDGAFVYCTNVSNCGAVNMSKIEHFASKDAMDVEGLSEKTIETLYNLGYIHNVSDLYDLTSENLLSIDGFKDKKTDNVLKAIDKSKNVSLDKFIFALGIANIGKKSAFVLAEHFKTLENLKNASFEDLSSLNDFGDIMAKSVYDYFHDEHNLILIDKLLSKGITIKEHKASSGVLEGLTICLTGSIPIPRSKAKDIIINNGGKVSDSVSKNVNIVIVGEDAGSKLEKAKKLGITIWSYDDFMSKIND